MTSPDFDSSQIPQLPPYVERLPIVILLPASLFILIMWLPAMSFLFSAQIVRQAYEERTKALVVGSAVSCVICLFSTAGWLVAAAYVVGLLRASFG